jgi:hypothetical protein
MNIPDELHKEYLILNKELEAVSNEQERLRSLLRDTYSKRLAVHNKIDLIKARVLKMLETSPKDVITAAQEKPAQEKPLINGC